MKINIFFFSKWKWKADALIQTLYKRAGLGQKKRNSFSRCARARPFSFLPLPTPLFSFATSRPYPRLATSKSPPPTLHGERVQREETKTPAGWEAGVRKKSSQRYYFIFRPFHPRRPTLICTPAGRSASQPFIGRLGNLQTLKRTKGNDGFLTPARTRVVMVEVVAMAVRVGKGHRRRPGDEKKNNNNRTG